MPEITNPRELFLHELGDILYVEQKLADEVLPKLISEVPTTSSATASRGHLRETRGHVENVKKVFEELDEMPKAEPCLGFEGLKKEHDKLVGDDAGSGRLGGPRGCGTHGELRDRGVRGPAADGEGARGGRRSSSSTRTSPRRRRRSASSRRSRRASARRARRRSRRGSMPPAAAWAPCRLPLAEHSLASGSRTHRATLPSC